MVCILPIKALRLAPIAGILLLAACAGKQGPAPATAAASASVQAPLAASTAAATATPSNAAKPTETGAFAIWLQSLRREASVKGISQRTLDQALSGIEPDQKVLDLDRNQPEFTLTFAQYAARTVTKQRIEQGRNLLEEHRPLLD